MMSVRMRRWRRLSQRGAGLSGTLKGKESSFSIGDMADEPRRRGGCVLSMKSDKAVYADDASEKGGSSHSR